MSFSLNTCWKSKYQAAEVFSVFSNPMDHKFFILIVCVAFIASKTKALHLTLWRWLLAVGTIAVACIHAPANLRTHVPMLMILESLANFLVVLFANASGMKPSTRNVLRNCNKAFLLQSMFHCPTRVFWYVTCDKKELDSEFCFVQYTSIQTCCYSTLHCCMYWWLS